MPLPFSINAHYTTHLSKADFIEKLSSLPEAQDTSHWGRAEVSVKTTPDGFVVQREHSWFPFTVNSRSARRVKIKGSYVSEAPLTIRIGIRPQYGFVLFLAIFMMVFGYIGLFVDKMTINGVYRPLELTDRLLFLLLGWAVPGLIGYVVVISPVKTAEKWIARKLALSRITK